MLPPGEAWKGIFMQNDVNVLVVDDDPNIRSAFEDLLRKERCRMIPSSDAADALRLLASHRVALVITDIRLGDRSGVTLLLDIKRLHPELPVIVITGHPGSIAEKDVRLYGAEYYFLKPLELDSLREAIRKCLRVTGAGPVKEHPVSSINHIPPH
jgi:DNA-binding NtrC family response regulator